jgi:hypothetical protein
VEYKGQWYQFYHNCSISERGNLRCICADKLFFNDDGTIKTVVQTKTGVPTIGPTPELNSNAVKYNVANATLGGGAVLSNDSSAAGGKAIQNLHLTDAYFQFKNVGGGANGGRATIEIHFSAEARSKLHLFVNDKDDSFLNALATGGWSNYTGSTELTVPLNPGKSNIVKLVGGTGGVNVDYITVTPLPE